VLFLGRISTLPFWVEFLLLPFLTVTTAMVAMTERQPEHRIVIAPLNGIVAMDDPHVRHVLQRKRDRTPAH
jgi:hypothetical protein